MTTPELIRAALEEAATFYRTMADYSLMDEGQALVRMLKMHPPCAAPYIQARAHLAAAAVRLDVETELALVLGVLGTMPEYFSGADLLHCLRYLSAALDLEKQHSADLRALALRLEAREMLVPKVDTTDLETGNINCEWPNHADATRILHGYLHIDGNRYIHTIGTCSKKISKALHSGDLKSNGKLNSRELRIDPENLEIFANKIYDKWDKERIRKANNRR